LIKEESFLIYSFDKKNLRFSKDMIPVFLMYAILFFMELKIMIK